MFIQTFSGDIDYSKQNCLQESLTTTGNAHNSNDNYDVRCNIYDMAGNIREWSTETYTDSSSPCVPRGGDYMYNTTYTAYSYYNRTNSIFFFFLFRCILYVK